MISLLIDSPAPDAGASAETRFGGQPSAPEGVLNWPTCKSCEGNMQFLGQLKISNQDSADSLLLLFMCQNDPGLCEEWDADAGGNAVVSVGCEALRLVEPPEAGVVVRPVLHGAKIEHVDGESYDEARDDWCDSTGLNGREILGQVGGSPSWIQGEEVPSCSSCDTEMSFVAQLEEGPDWETAMNFGSGGCAYVYRCNCDAHQAKLLWQC